MDYKIEVVTTQEQIIQDSDGRERSRVETPNLCHVANAHGPQLPHVFPTCESSYVLKLSKKTEQDSRQ